MVLVPGCSFYGWWWADFHELFLFIFELRAWLKRLNFNFLLAKTAGFTVFELDPAANLVQNRMRSAKTLVEALGVGTVRPRNDAMFKYSARAWRGSCLVPSAYYLTKSGSVITNSQLTTSQCPNTT